MATLAMWKRLELMTNLYGKRLRLQNHVISVSERKILLTSDPTRKARYFVITSTLFVALHTMLAFVITTKPIFVKTSEQLSHLEMVRTYTNILCVFIPRAFFAMSCVTSFTPYVSIVVLNHIVNFQSEAKGNVKQFGNISSPMEVLWCHHLNKDFFYMQSLWRAVSSLNDHTINI